MFLQVEMLKFLTIAIGNLLKIYSELGLHNSLNRRNFCKIFL